MSFSVNKDQVKVVVDSIYNAFVWSKSPQGKDYWRDVILALCAFGVDDPGGGTPPRHGIDRQLGRKARRALSQAFSWSMSPQGHTYWDQMDTHLSDMLTAHPPSIAEGDGNSEDEEEYVKAFDRAMRGL